MTERMGLAAVGRQNRQRAALARRAELRPAARRLAAVEWDLRAAGPFCTVH